MSSAKNNPGKPGHKSRIDVSAAGPSLTQNPFAKLALTGVAPLSASAESAAAPVAKAPAVEKTRSRGRLLLRRETKHRGGKTVVVISGFAALRDASAATIGDVEKRLKQRLGCGGSIDLEKQEVLIQGDRPEDIAALLKELGFDVAGVTTRPGR
jgi:translation initiation factor 1